MSKEHAARTIPWEQVVAGASALAAQVRLADMAARFLALVESWGSPSAVLCAVRDAAAAEGLRMVPELTSGTLTAGAERALAKLFTDYPADTLTGPTLLEPPEGAVGFKVRDTLVIPWSNGSAASGFLVLRGLPRPQATNLGDAVSLLAQPVWSRFGNPVEAPPKAESTGEGIETRLRELEGLVGRLGADWLGAVESLKNAAASGGEQSAAAAEAAGKAREQAETERDAARNETAELRNRVESAQRELETARSQAEATGKAREQAEMERDAARSEATELRGRIDAMQGELDAVRSRAEETRGRAEAAVAATAAAAERGERAEADTRVAAGRVERSVELLRSAFEAIRRTPFVPPTVRVWVGEAQAFLDPQPANVGPRLGRILLLDRDAPMLSTLAGELEEAGLEVLIAHQPDEVTLFLKTPDASGLTALVLDVLTLRPDQNLAELVRGWRRDLASLALFLTFRADNTTEAERAQRIPSTATAGYLPRPLQKASLLDAVAKIARRPSKR